MTTKTRQASLCITRELFELSHLDVLSVTLGRLLAEVPGAQVIELSVIEHYEDEA